MSYPVAGYPTAPQQGQPPLRDQYGQVIQSAPPQGWQPPPVQAPPPQPVPPQQYQQPPQQAPQQGQPGQLDMNQRLHGPNVPPEIQGKTLGEAMRFYNVMRQDFLERQQGQRQQQPQNQGVAPGQQPGQPQYQGQQPQRGYIPPQQQESQDDAIRRVAADAVRSVVAPILQPIQQASSRTVKQGVAARFHDWGQFDQQIEEMLSGADPSVLMNPGIWETAYYNVKGRAFSQPPQQGQQQFQQGAPAPQQFQPQQQPWQTAAPQAQPPYNPNGYFVESPTPAAPSPTGAGPNVAEPHDHIMARKFNMPVEEYRLWKGGNVAPPPQAQVQTQQFTQQPPQYPQQQPAPYGYPMVSTPNGGYYGR